MSFWSRWDWANFEFFYIICHGPEHCSVFQAAKVFVFSNCNFLILVLEEDGTVVDSEEFFQSLPCRTPLMVLDKGELWTPNKVGHPIL